MGDYQRFMAEHKDAGMNDLSFNLSNNMMGFGLRIHATEKLDIDAGYMHTFYKDKNVTTQVTPTIAKTDKYERTNDVFAIGVNLNF